ncbi:hypothetical protein BC937DRAFT_87313 [Endogone sp. FLAS-F59071]|nr:hypothetical protein BC937DRAFT_87313 [Endogone sp. FLAS-F59071]|eukprot:RUS19546.1 hypothetical protein BC937DRAFT_87313 [Endogone sp. FLAS-F59071]
MGRVVTGNFILVNHNSIQSSLVAKQFQLSNITYYPHTSREQAEWIRGENQSAVALYKLSTVSLTPTFATIVGYAALLTYILGQLEVGDDSMVLNNVECSDL